MNWKYGAKTAATAGVMDRPFAEDASAALLSVPWEHATGPRQRGSWDSIQNVSANCTRSSQAAICFCMSAPTQFQCSWAWASVIWNWNHTHLPSGKKAAPPNPAKDEDAIASAVAVTFKNAAGDMDNENGVDTSSFSQRRRVSPASSSSTREGEVGSWIPIHTRRDLMWSFWAWAKSCTCVLATRTNLTWSPNDWCLWVKSVVRHSSTTHLSLRASRFSATTWPTCRDVNLSYYFSNMDLCSTLPSSPFLSRPFQRFLVIPQALSLFLSAKIT